MHISTYYRAACIIIAYFLLPVSIRLYGQTYSRNIDSLHKVISNSKTDTDKVNNLIHLSESYSCADTINKIHYANKALQLAENINWQKGIINTNITLGFIYKSCINNYAVSITYFQNAVAIAKKSGNKLQEAIAINYIANTYGNLSKYSIALDYYQQVLALKTNVELEPGILGNMGVIYTNIGDYRRALSCYDSSLKILDEQIGASKGNKEINKLQMAGLLISIGDVYFEMSQYTNALSNYKSALKITEETNDKSLAHYALTAIGTTYHQQKNDTLAIEYYILALKNCKEFNNLQDEPNIYNLLASVYLKKNDLSTAMAYAQKSLELAEKNNLLDQLPVTYTTLGKILTAQIKYSAAVNYLQKAVSICSKNCAIVNEKDAWEALTITYKQMNKPAEALDAYEHFITIRDSVYNIDKAKELTRALLQGEFDRQKQAQADANNLKMQKQRLYTISGYAGLVVVLLLSFFIYRNYSHQKNANVAISKANEVMNDEKQRSEALLLNILPENVAKELKNNGNVEAKLFDQVTVLFTDFVNFTEAGERLSPQELVAELHTCFMAFDRITGKYNIEKIKTVGDAYLAVSGLPHANPNHAADIVKAAIECRDYMISRKKAMGDNTFSMRVGINSGTVVAGIVGAKKFAYDIWGDTVNTAARMEQYSEPDKINISQTTYELVKGQFTCTDRGEIDAKHKGKMRMYFVEHNS